MSTSAPNEPTTRAARHAQRAAQRVADRRVPVSRPRPLVIVGVVVSALVLAGSAASGLRALEIAAVVLAGLVVAVGWPRLVDSPTPAGSSVVLAVTTVALGAALLAKGEEPFLEQVPAAVAVGIIAMCLHPLVQASARVDLARGLAGTALGILVISCGAALTSTAPHSASPVVIAGIALAVAGLVDLVTERGRVVRWMLPVGMLAGGIAGVGAHWVLDSELAPWAALVGVLGAGVALSLRRALSQQPAVEETLGGVTSGVASVLLVGPLLHLIARLPLG
ncbi:hypothetical protein [Janibacter alittae]|uniref:Permease n=1 Tax=Janibacter alittae TaxID=3115209 RepID=A0ABZ2MIE3_9MICO